MREESSAEQAAWERICAKGRERLKARLAEHKVSVVPLPPSFDNILVLRLPLKEKVTAGGIILNATSKHGEWQAEPESEGILVGAGLQALDYLRAHGIVVGDHVEIGRFAGWEREAKLIADGKNTARVLYMKSADILRSFDFGERLAANELAIDYNAETGEHFVRIVT